MADEPDIKNITITDVHGRGVYRFESPSRIEHWGEWLDRAPTGASFAIVLLIYATFWIGFWIGTANWA